MKPLYIPLLILTGLLALSLWFGYYTNQQAQEWIVQLEQADRLARDAQWDRASNQIQQTYDSWTSSHSMLHSSLDHEELDDAENLFAAALAACDTQDIPDFHTAIAQLRSKLHLLAEAQSISLGNIL